MKKLIYSVFLFFSLNIFAAGNLEVLTEPAGAKISVEFLNAHEITTDANSLRTQDQRFQNGPAIAGNSPVLIEYIGVGRFRVIAELAGYEKATKEALVLDQETTTVKFKLKKGSTLPLPNVKITEQKKYRIEIKMTSPSGEVPILNNLSEIIFQSPSGEKYVIDKIDIESGNLPPGFNAKTNDTKYVISNLTKNWHLIAQMNNSDLYSIHINVFDNKNELVYTNREKGSYSIISVYSWELN